jgi:hypothetical protein
MAGRAAPDFEAWETLLLQAARQGGAGVLGTLLKDWQQKGSRPLICCRCGRRMSSQGRRAKHLLTVLGKVPFARSRYQCEHCSQTRLPDDERLDIVLTSYSPGVRRLMARAGSQTQFEQAAQDLLCYAGLELEPREIERVAEGVGREVEQWLGQEQSRLLECSLGAEQAPHPIPKFYASFDGTGVPVRPSELAGRRGKQSEGSARTREAKLGCIFTQIGVDSEGHPQREPDSTTYVGATESSQLFGWRIYAEAVRRGLEQAREVIVLSDGARYNHTIANTHFARATHIVDLFHAFEHLNLMGQLLWGPEAKTPKPWRELLEAREIAALLRKAGKKLPPAAANKDAMRKALHYFEENAPQMRYADFRKRKLFLGSGVARRDAARSSASGSNNLGCAGRCAEPTRLSLCAAA